MQIKLRALLIALPTLFTLACDDAEYADVPDASEVAAPAGELPLTSMQHTESGLAAQIAAHPAFAPLSQRAYLRVGDLLAAKAAMTEAELEASYSRLEHCRNESNELCAEEVLASGIDPTLSPSELQLGQQLTAAFNLGAYTRSERTILFRNAQAAYIAGGGAGPGLGLIPDTFEAGTVSCDNSCKADILAGMADTHAGTLARTSEGEGGGDETPWWVEVGIAAGTAVIGCLINPDCDLWPFEGGDNPPKECTSNGDCASDEYCWKGPLGIGENECRDKKKIGDSCGKDSACKSDCCKFNLWDGGSTCRKASECN